jgi:cellulose synthase/poly-beta-1,6-N-acetylglucosamine synthase-like glycosyltransferase
MHVLESVLWYLFLAAQLILAIYLLIPTLLLCLYGLFKALKVKTPFQRKPFLTEKKFEFGIIITAHQETKFIFPLVDSVLKQTYPNYHVYVVADDCDISDLNFPDQRVHILRPEPSLNAKIKSIHYAIDQFIHKHDAVIIFDADNLIHPRFLEVMNAHFQKGYRVVQADFKPKNTDSHYARMDAIGDMFNFFVEREARMVLNLSAAIWGSGVAIDYDLYTEVKYTSFLGGFDKKLQSHLVQRVKRIAFAPDAVLFDEKISSGKSLETQRTRWISSYFKYFKESLAIMFAGIRRGSFNLFYFGFITLRPPLFMVLGGGILFTILNFFLSLPLFYTWLGIFAAFILSFALIVAVKGKDLRFMKTFFLLPLFVFQQVMALLKLKKAKKSFLKTEHSSLVYIDDLLDAKR